MKAMRNSLAYCAKENKPCVGWVEKYFKDCLCNLRDEFSFGFGLISLVCWGIAEIPQIVTNFRTKTSHGVSLLFLLTWIIGDIFNLVGCLLEPATLPTQYYTALLYTTSTVVLVLQSLYYDHVYSWWKCKQIEQTQAVEEEKKLLMSPKQAVDSSIPIPGGTPMVLEFYYTSARSLARSSTPPAWSYLSHARSGPSTMVLDGDSSSEDEPIQVSSKKSRSKPQPIPRSAGAATFLATTISLPQGSKAFIQVYTGLTGRRLLNDWISQEQSTEDNVYGQWLGWMMAAIYMGGRIPQIVLNIKRGSVEGLNPLMFIFALVANATYVGSIVMRTTEWDKTKANLPWLLDAVVCVVLDLFIILQYIYYRYVRNKITSGAEDYVEASKGP
ncbi:probable vacuolar amino acid transporter YPQ1 isoform X1 [Rhododendron vialii]|uniref:probable vacuolar amino acid transporter YPQ1 isoform X1 n=1 Tax=Rhododendron vialii TaxID=182163 RepID=UPI00265F760A|nr:probable vacuolar amino acid transporter YPQ1 isoform X1 [Rhododendron vialii]XP_058228567.1 probable vacuolar amino acid transporter YPQ1 isoform X1 [Rhododendron vialii]